MGDFLKIFDYYGPLFFVLVASYLIGGINFSILVTRKFGINKDIREMGSGNAGFTNVLRSVGRMPAILTFLGDFAKGVLAVWLSKVIFLFIQKQPAGSDVIDYFAYLASFACVLGHIYPYFFGFRGGKGILTGWATTLLIDLRVFFIVISVFLVVLIIWKIVSLASIFAAASCPIATFLVLYSDFKMFNGDISYVIMCTVISLVTASLILFSHKSNISRILSKTEGKLTY